MSSSSNRPPPIPATVPQGVDDVSKKKMKKRKGSDVGRNDDDDDDDDDDIVLDDDDGKRRFEWELEFVQCLASPAYLHFLATYRDDDDESEESDNDNDDEIMEDADVDGKDKVPRHTNKKSAGAVSSGLLHDPHFQAYLRYLRDTWSRPEYAIYLSYPHCLYFLNLIIEHPTIMAREWAQPSYRNFCHQQQFLAWQHRHSSLYGRGGGTESGGNSTGSAGSAATTPSDAT